MKCILLLALFAVAAQAGPSYKPRPVLCPLRSCYCLPAYTGAPVDCATCACRACVAPKVEIPHAEDDCTPEPVVQAPLYLTRAGTCEKCTAVNCDDDGCNELGACRKCREGFSRDIATGACVEATPLPNCRKASRYDSTKCEECVIGYTRDFAGQCTQCAAGCAKCRAGSTACYACLPGFGRTAAGTCVPCGVANCGRCDYNQAVCQACMPVTDPKATSFFVLSNGACTEFPLV